MTECEGFLTLQQCSKGGSARSRSFTQHKLRGTQCTAQSPSPSSNNALPKTSSGYTVDDTKKRAEYSHLYVEVCNAANLSLVNNPG